MVRRATIPLWSTFSTEGVLAPDSYMCFFVGLGEMYPTKLTYLPDLQETNTWGMPASNAKHLAVQQGSARTLTAISICYKHSFHVTYFVRTSTQLQHFNKASF